MTQIRFNKELYDSSKILLGIEAFNELCSFEYGETETHIVIWISNGEDPERIKLEMQNYILALHK